MLASDVALVGRDLPFVARQPLDGRDRRVAVDLGATLTRAARQRLRQIGRLDVTVLGMLDGADNSVDIAKRPDVFDLARRQELDGTPIVSATPA